MMHRKAQMVKFIIGIVIALMIFIPTVLWAGELFRLSDDAKDSFNELIQKINEISEKPAGTIEPIAFDMDENTAILGFAKNAEKIQCTTFGNDAAYFERPKSCGKNNSCLCLCRNGYAQAKKNPALFLVIKDVAAADEVSYWLITCSNLICTPLNEKVDFPKTISAGVLATPEIPEWKGLLEEDPDVKTYGGFVLERGKRFFNPYMEDSGRERPIYLKKKESTVVLCRSSELCDQ